MSNSQRPSHARKQTRKTIEKADEELDRGYALDDDGVRLTVRLRDVRGSHDAALVKIVGYDFMGLLEAMSKRQGLDLLAAAVWFARLVNGRSGCTEDDYKQLLDEVGFNDYLERDIDEPKAEDDAPKAPASDS